MKSLQTPLNSNTQAFASERTSAAFGHTAVIAALQRAADRPLAAPVSEEKKGDRRETLSIHANY